MKNKIVIQNVGPGKNVEIKLEGKGGIAVLEALNGRGKSHILNAVERHVTGEKLDVPVTDGEQAAMVQGFGATLLVTKSTKRIGNLEVSHLDGRGNISTVIDPDIDDEAAADKRRINALLRMSGIGGDPKYFHDFFGGKEEFDRLVPPNCISKDDIVETAAKIKRHLESVSRDAAARAEEANIQVIALQSSLESHDLSLADDLERLTDVHERAVANLSSLRAQREQAKQIHDAAEMARINLSSQKEKYTGGTSQETKLIIDDLTKQAENLEKVLQAVRHSIEKEKLNLNAALKHEENVNQWKEMIEKADKIKLPDDEEISGAEAVAKSAKADYNFAMFAAQLKPKAEQLEAERKKHLDFARKAESLRELAKSVENVLSSLIDIPGLKIEAGRIMVTNHKRGKIPFADLSEGERGSFILPFAAKVIGNNGFLVIEQGIWQDLDYVNKSMLHEKAVECGVWILTAAALQEPNGKTEGIEVKYYNANKEKT